MRPVVADSAHKHGIDDDALLHAYRNAIAFEVIREGFTMIIGPNRSGDLLEVGVVEADTGNVVIVHAMRARQKYLKHLR